MLLSWKTCQGPTLIVVYCNWKVRRLDELCLFPRIIVTWRASFWNRCILQELACWWRFTLFWERFVAIIIKFSPTYLYDTRFFLLYCFVIFYAAIHWFLQWIKLFEGLLNVIRVSHRLRCIKIASRLWFDPYTRTLQYSKVITSLSLSCRIALAEPTCALQSGILLVFFNVENFL